jgi:small subunit ribosomal protein S8
MSKSAIVSSDPIADMLTRIRNAIAVNSQTTSMPYSKIKENVARILADNNFVDSVEVTEEEGRKTLIIRINQDNESAKITEIKRLSRPGRRMYVKSPAVPTVRRGRGMVVISTSSGIMTGTEAKAKKLGGELICEVY